MIFKERLNLAISIISLLKASKEIINTSQISDQLQVSVSYIEQSLKVLSDMRIVIGKRGPSGGYQLRISEEKYDVSCNIKYHYRNVLLTNLFLALYPESSEKHTCSIKSEIFMLELSDIIN